MPASRSASTATVAVVMNLRFQVATSKRNWRAAVVSVRSGDPRGTGFRSCCEQTGSESFPTTESHLRQHRHRQSAEALLADRNRLAALGAEDVPVARQGREDHVLEGGSVAQGVP